MSDQVPDTRWHRSVALVRRHPLRVIVLLAIAAFAALGIGRPLVGDGSLHGADLLMQYAPWRDIAPAGFVAQRPCVSDTVDSGMPATAEFRRRLLDGDFAEWNSLAGPGTPLGAVPNAGLLSPLSAPSIVLSPWLSPAYLKLLEIIVGVLGMYLFLRQLSLVRSAALLGGLVFVSSGFLVTWTNYPQTRTATFIPWVFWAVERFVRRHTLISAIPIALAVAAMFLGGFPAVTGYALYAVVPYLVLRAATLSKARARRWLDAGTRTVIGIGFIGLGGGLVAFQLLPFASQLNDLGLSRAQTAAAHLPLLSLVTAAAPTVYGACGARSPYFGPFNDVEMNAFIGAAALVLAGVAVLRGPSSMVPRGVRGYFAGATVVTVALGWWGHWPLRLAQKFPVFSNNPVFRIRSMLGFFVAVLAAIGYDRLVRAPRPGSRNRAIVEAVGWGLVAAVAADALHKLDSTYSSNQLYNRDNLVLPLVAGGLAFLIVLALAFRPVVNVRAVKLSLLAVLPVIVAIESITFAHGFWPHTPRDEFYPDTSVHQYLAANDHDGARYMGTGFTMFPGVNVYYDLSSPNGHVFTPLPWMELLKTVDPTVAKTQTFTEFSPGLSTTRLASPILDRLAVRYVVTDPRDPIYGTTKPVGTATGAIALAASQSVRAQLPPGPLRGIGVDLTSRPQLEQPAWLVVDVLDAKGNVLVHNRRRFTPADIGNFTVALAGETLGAQTHVARLTLDAPTGSITLGAVGTTPVIDVVRPANDGLRLVFAGGATVYERAHALPRVRWASNVVVAPDKLDRLTFLANREPPNTVVLDAPVPRTSGQPAQVKVLSQGGDSVHAHVDAHGDGYLVVADALTNGWVATVDGHEVPLVTADHAMVAVRVGAGSHDVRLRYRPTHQLAGFALSFLTVVLFVVIVIVTRRANSNSGQHGAKSVIGWLRRRPLGVIVVIAIAAFAVIGIGKPLIGSQTFSASDFLLLYAPWHDAAPEHFVPQMMCASDPIDSGIPAITEFRSRLLDGDYADWTSNSVGGTPLGSVPNAGLLSPVAAPKLSLSPWLAPAYVKLLEIIVGVLGMYLFLRQLSLVRSGALLGGLLFVSSGFLVTFTNWPQAHTATFIPWVFWAIERFVKRHTLVGAIPVALVLAAMLLSGFPAVTGYTLYAVVPYAAVRALSSTPSASPRHWLDASARVALACVFFGLGGALVAFQLLPFRSWLDGVFQARTQTAGVHLPVLSLVTAVAPKIYGNCTIRNPYFGPNVNIEVIAFIGAAALVLVGVAILRGASLAVPRGVRGYFIAGVAITLLLGWGGRLPLRIAQLLPVFSNNPSWRLRALLGFFLAVLAAIGFDRLVRAPRPDNRRRGTLEAAGWVGAAAVAVTGLVMFDRRYASNPNFHLRPLVLPVVAGTLALVIVAALASRRVPARSVARTALLAALPVIVAVESTSFALGFWAPSERDTFFPDTTVHQYLATNTDAGSWRYIALGPTMWYGTNVYYGLSSPTGRAFVTRPWLDLLTAVDFHVSEAEARTGYPEGLTTQQLASPILDRFAVRYVVTDPHIVYGAKVPLSTPTGHTTLAAGQSTAVRVPGGALRGAAVELDGDGHLTGPAWLRVDVLDATGKVLASNRRRLDTSVHNGLFALAIAGEQLRNQPGPLTARLTLDAPSGSVVVKSTGATPALTLWRPTDDGLRLAFAGPATVWERTHALPRVRWTSNVAVQPSRAARVHILAGASAPNTVVLNQPVAPTSGQPADVDVVHQGGDSVHALVNARGDGYLVVADAFTNGWIATVDGHHTPLVTADHAMAAVRVPAGRHDVQLRYEPPGQSAGFAVSGLTAVLLVLMAFAPAVIRSRSQKRARA